MRRLLAVIVFALLALSFASIPAAASAQATPKVDVRSQFSLSSYGYAVINETVKFSNSEALAEQIPTITLGFGPVAADIVNHTLSGSGFVLSTTNGTGPFVVSGGSVPAEGSSSFDLSLLLNGLVTVEANGTVVVKTLSWPSLNLNATVSSAIKVPPSVSFATAPTGYYTKVTGTNTTYTLTKSNFAPKSAAAISEKVSSTSAEDMHPLEVYSATRTISSTGGGAPTVTDSISFRNLGPDELTSIAVEALAGPNSSVTVLESTSPRLIGSMRVSIANGTLPLASVTPGYPSGGVGSGENYSLTYEYALGPKYFTESGGQVTVSIPVSPPVPAFIDSYTVRLAVPSGQNAVKSPKTVLSEANPWTKGSVTLSYGLTEGWALNAGTPTASILFVIMLLGLFVSRGALTVEEEEEEETSSEKATAMVTAFDEKTDLINGFWPEIAGKDPNELSKEYFDTLKSRLEAFRGRALQRMNDIRQTSTTQRFADLLGQIQATEREVDRACKDKLNLYEQFYLRRMRKDVYDKLLPQYTKRLEKALNQLTDELHVIQKEAKLL